MAVYEFLCRKCNHEFEVMRPISKADEPSSCPKCGTIGEKLASVFSLKAEYSVTGPEKDAFRGTKDKTQSRTGKEVIRRSNKA